MRKLIVPQQDVEEIGSSMSAAEEMARHRQRQRDSVQSIISAVLIVGLLVVILWLIVIIPWRWETSPIVT